MLGERIRVHCLLFSCLGSRTSRWCRWCLGFRNFWFRVRGLGFRVQGLGLRVRGLGFRVGM